MSDGVVRCWHTVIYLEHVVLEERLLNGCMSAIIKAIS